MEDQDMHPLDAWLKAQKKTRLWLASELQTTEATLSRLIAGKQWPSRDLATAIAAITRGKITANHFIYAPAPSRQSSRPRVVSA